jgi:hyperosmotically inducible protein
MPAKTLLSAALFGLALAIAGCASPTARTPVEAVDDAAIATKVKAKFVEDPAVKALNIKVDSRNGVVHLSGFAASAAEAEKAAQLARTTAGVKSVTNDIRLASK